jgi:hypothetical protein
LGQAKGVTQLHDAERVARLVEDPDLAGANLSISAVGGLPGKRA